jgi:hypothetical protein
MGKVYAIMNLDGYASEMREAAASSLCETHTENLDEYITLNQIINLVNTKCIGFDNENRPLLDDNTNESIYEDTAIWIHNVGLAKLASQDLVECAWDDEINEMIFWAKETKKNNHDKQRKPRRKNKKSEG